MQIYTVLSEGNLSLKFTYVLSLKFSDLKVCWGKKYDNYEVCSLVDLVVGALGITKWKLIFRRVFDQSKYVFHQCRRRWEVGKMRPWVSDPSRPTAPLIISNPLHQRIHQSKYPPINQNTHPSIKIPTHQSKYPAIKMLFNQYTTDQILLFQSSICVKVYKVLKLWQFIKQVLSKACRIRPQFKVRSTLQQNIDQI